MRGPPFGRSSPPLSRRGFPGWPSVHAHAAPVRVSQRQNAATPGALAACGGHGEEHSGPQVQRPDERLFIRISGRWSLTLEGPAICDSAIPFLFISKLKQP